VYGTSFVLVMLLVLLLLNLMSAARRL